MHDNQTANDPHHPLHPRSWLITGCQHNLFTLDAFTSAFGISKVISSCIFQLYETQIKKSHIETYKLYLRLPKSSPKIWTLISSQQSCSDSQCTYSSSDIHSSNCITSLSSCLCSRSSSCSSQIWSQIGIVGRSCIVSQLTTFFGSFVLFGSSWNKATST